jgi:NAD(P)-dependent dehydrogenase (short-subunit alcohol dehydrogenase family)
MANISPIGYISAKEDRPMGTFDGKVALVTGAGQGIGRGIALALAAEGAAVAVIGRTKDKLDDTVREIESRGGQALACPGDVRNEGDVSAIVSRVIQDLGGLHILVNNAQEYAFGSIADMDLGALDAAWRSGAVGTLHLMRAAHPHLAGDGVVINVSSGAASEAMPQGVGGYAAVKAAIESLSRAAAVEWAPEGIRVVTLIPFARTPAVAAVLDSNPGMEEMLLSSVPLNRFADPEAELGRAAVFLASSDASFITGSSLVVDGGSTYLR